MGSIVMKCWFLLLVWSQFAVAIATHHNRELAPRNNEPERRLSAITVRTPLQKRGIPDFKPKTECKHHYADHSTILRGSRSRFAKTSTKFYWPTLSLEDVELHTTSIRCFDSSIVVQFSSSIFFQQAMADWQNLSKFLVISSHAGCNADGERSPYLASQITYKPKILTAAFSVEKIAWTDAYDTMTVDFGMGKYHPSSLRLHQDLRKRATATSNSTGVAAATGLSAPIPLVTITSSNGTSNESTTLELGLTIPANEQIFPQKGLVDPTNGALTVACKTCNLTGDIEFTAGSFVISNATDTISKAVNFVENGFLEAAVDGMSATIELDIGLKEAISTAFNTSLGGPFSLTPFFIPGVGSVGPMFNPVISASVTAAIATSFTYGFSMTVPNNSTLVIDIGNNAGSQSTGFNNTSISSLPLTSTDPALSLTLGLGFRAELLFGVTLLEGVGSASAGAFIDLPSLSVSFSLISGDSKCDTISSNTSQIISQAFPSLLNIVPQAVIDIGLEAGASLAVAQDLLPGITLLGGIGTTTTIAKTTFALPTECLSFDSSKTTFISPPTATGTGTGSATGSAGNASYTGGVTPITFNGFAGQQITPFGEMGLVGWTGGMLGGVLLIALAL